MINLIPEGERKYLKREYGKRVAVVVSSFSIVTAIIALGILLPSYIISKEKLVLIKEEAVDLEKRGVSTSTQAIDYIALANEKINILRMEKAPLPVLPLIERLVSVRGSNIFITSISYEKKGATAKIDVLGVAGTRDALTSYVDRLKREPRFAEVFSPVSNLVRDRNIDFTIQIAITP